MAHVEANTGPKGDTLVTKLSLKGGVVLSSTSYGLDFRQVDDTWLRPVTRVSEVSFVRAKLSIDRTYGTHRTSRDKSRVRFRIFFAADRPRTIAL